MAIKAGLVGVNPKGVDKNGMPIGSGGANVEAEIEQINLDIAQLQASKVGVGQLTANNKAFHFAYDSTSEKYGYKLDGTGDFIPFEQAGGGPGWVTPANLETTGLTYNSYIEYTDGGYEIIDGVCYFDLTIHQKTSGAGTINGMPSMPAYCTFLTKKGDSTAVAEVYDGADGSKANGSSAGTTLSLTNIGVGNYLHIFGAYTVTT